MKYNPIVDPAEWITLKVFKSSHQKAAPHIRSVNLKKRDEEDQARRLQDTPDFFATPNDIDFIGPSAPQASGNPPSHDPMQDLWDGFDGTFGLDGGVREAHETARKKFDIEAHEYGLWNGLEEMSADTDMINVEQIWDEEDEDDLLSELLEHIGLLPNLVCSEIGLTTSYNQDLSQKALTPQLP
jgi:hypothetical protein